MSGFLFKNAGAFNKLQTAMLAWPVIGPIMQKKTCVITYTGRKSGKTFSTPVWYTPTANGITIRVGIPKQKSWWKNFRGEGAPMTVTIGNETKTGHAAARIMPGGATFVDVEFTA